MATRRFSNEVSLTRAEARRLALAAQGFGARRTTGRSAWPRVEATIGRMGLLQLDSVSALVRAHYLPVFSRIGDYDRAGLDRRGFGERDRQFFEYWGHEASLLPWRFHTLLRWRMARAEALRDMRPGAIAFAREERAYLRSVLDEVRRRGPITANELEDPGKRNGPWWGWHKGKAALEYLFRTGAVAAAGRRGFERVYDLGERIVPAEILGLPTPDERDAIRDLVAFAGGALGVATEVELRDYFRLPVAETRRAVAELVEAGSLLPAVVDGWSNPAFVPASAELPARVNATALLSPFDPLVWHRQRTERLFGFHYRIEIYTPSAKRRFGYYVLPFLHNGHLVARFDLRANRRSGHLEVPGAHLEAGATAERTAPPAAAELRHLAAWLGLPVVRVAGGSDFAAAIARVL
jgi:uncharacterized protein YcaQ